MHSLDIGVQSELLWVHVGQCGAQLAEELWELLGDDHHIGDDSAPRDQPPYAAFKVRKDGDHVPRNLCIDTDCSPICKYTYE